MSEADNQPKTDSTEVTPQSGGSSEQVVSPPEGFPEHLWKDGAPDVAAIAELAALRADQQKRGEDIPADGVYTLTLPEDVATYDGKPVAIDTESTAAKVLLAAAAKLKLTRSEVNELTAMAVKAEIEQGEAAAKAEAEARIADLKKLGDKPQARLDALVLAVKANIPDAPQAEALLKSIATADAALALEALVGRLTGKSASPPPPQGAAPEKKRPAEILYPNAAKAAKAA